MIQHDLSRGSGQRDRLATATLRVNMIADLICPWCYLGKRRLDAALRAVHGPSALHWFPFQINPDMPAAGMGFEEYLSARFGDPASVQPGLDQLTRAGAAEGIRFRFDLMRRVPNTLNAHRLVKYAETEGANTGGVAEDILSSFFEEGLDIADREVLIEVGGHHGIDRHHVVHTLDDERSRRLVLSQEADVRRGGISAVPNFLINDRLFVIGAQPTSVLVDAFDRAMFGNESNLPVSDILH